MADASKEFDIYLKNVYGGHSDAHIAMMEQSRIDGYSHAEAMKNAQRNATVSRDSLPSRRKGGGRTRALEPDSESESETASLDDEEGNESESESESESGSGVGRSGVGGESENGSRTGRDSEWRRGGPHGSGVDRDGQSRVSTGKGRS